MNEVKFQKPTHCPECGKKIKPEQYRRYPKETFDLVIHELKPDPAGFFNNVTKSCIVRKDK